MFDYFLFLFIFFSGGGRVKAFLVYCRVVKQLLVKSQKLPSAGYLYNETEVKDYLSLCVLWRSVFCSPATYHLHIFVKV